MSPRTPKQFEEIREEKKTLIMNIALEHFANVGYHAATINHIAGHAGISKGLMYNYFDSKEQLLAAIIRRSVLDVYSYFDIDRDGYLTEEEFEYFVRRVNLMLKDNKSFWRLFFQLLMQNDVREHFLKSFLGADSLIHSGIDPKDGLFVTQIMKMITDYFLRKKEKRGEDFDPMVDMNMFIITLKGFAITCIYTDDREAENNEKMIKRIIEIFK